MTAVSTPFVCTPWYRFHYSHCTVLSLSTPELAMKSITAPLAPGKVSWIISSLLPVHSSQEETGHHQQNHKAPSFHILWKAFFRSHSRLSGGSISSCHSFVCSISLQNSKNLWGTLKIIQEKSCNPFHILHLVLCSQVSPSINREILDLESTFSGSHLIVKNVLWISSSNHVSWSTFSTGFQQQMKADYSLDFSFRNRTFLNEEILIHLQMSHGPDWFHLWTSYQKHVKMCFKPFF